MRKGEEMEIMKRASFREYREGAEAVGPRELRTGWEALAAMELQLFAEGDGGGADGGTGGGTDVTGNLSESGDDKKAVESEIGGHGGRTESGGKEADAGQDLTHEFEDLIKGRFKEEYSRRTQNIINRRFREVKELEEFKDRYGESVEKLGALWGCSGDSEEFSRRAALLSTDEVGVAADTVGAEREVGDGEVGEDKVGTSVETAEAAEPAEVGDVAGSSAEKSALAAKREVLRGIREMRREALWKSFESGLRKCAALYPSFDPAVEVKDGRFVSMLRGGASVVDAYRAVHHGEILEGTVKASAAKVAEAVLASVRCRGSRPAENGLSSRAQTRGKRSAASFTDSDINAILRRVKNGEKIVL